MFTRNRKRSIIGAIVAILAITAAAAAYWTAGGGGTGTGTAGNSTALIVNQTTTVTGLHPGDSPQTLSGTFTNTTNGGPVHVSTVTVSISSVDKAVGAPAGTCTAADFTLTGAAMTVGAEIPAGTGVGAWTGATIQFNTTAANQDACKLATVNLAYAVV